MIATVTYIKEKAGGIILSRFPAHKQANAIARALELTRKELTGQTLTPGEAAEMAAIEAIWTWVRAVRAHSDTLEAAILADQAPHIEDIEWPA